LSTGTDLLRAEKIIEDIESSIDEIWNGEEYLQVAFRVEYADLILNRIEKSPPSIFVRLYIEEMGKVSDLRKRWLAARDKMSVAVLSSVRKQIWQIREGSWNAFQPDDAWR
jgi:hypothetical protein